MAVGRVAGSRGTRLPISDGCPGDGDGEFSCDSGDGRRGGHAFWMRRRATSAIPAFAEHPGHASSSPFSFSKTRANRSETCSPQWSHSGIGDRLGCPACKVRLGTDGYILFPNSHPILPNIRREACGGASSSSRAPSRPRPSAVPRATTYSLAVREPPGTTEPENVGLARTPPVSAGAGSPDMNLSSDFQRVVIPSRV
jgi:hypothetical protein